MKKVLGLVEWTNRDRRGSPIAGVRPLVELQKGEWRPIEAREEFPSQGQVFWPNAQDAAEQAFIVFRAEENAGQRDEFKVVDPKLAYEVLDLRRYGSTAEVRAVLIDGIRLPGPFGRIRALVWCKPDVLVGPVELSRDATGTRLVRANLHRLAAVTGAQVRPVAVGGVERLLRVDDAAPSSFVDWDDDAIVLRRALEAAVRVAKQAGRDAGQTKKQLEDAAKALAAQGIGADAQLDRYRLERARALLGNTDAVAREATELAQLLQEHTAIRSSLEELRSKVRAEVEQSARAELDEHLARERAALQEAADAHARTTSQLKEREQELRSTEERLAEIQGQVACAAKEVEAAEAAVVARLRGVLDRPLDLLAEVSVLRPFLGAPGASGSLSGTVSPTSPTSSRLNWSTKRGESSINDRATLRRILTSAARAHGVDASLMFHVHAAAVARLMPVTLGPSAVAALAAYAHGACGGRFHIVHVSPSAIRPHDFDDAPGGGLLTAIAAAKDVDGISFVVLEGANRSPLEASVVPLLQMTDVGLSPLSVAPGLCIAASMVTGATTVPVTPQLWSHAAAVSPEPSVPSGPPGTSGDIVLASELLVPGDEPKGVIDALLEAWPDCRELRPSMSRLGAALARLYDEDARISKALRSGLILPYVATALSAEEQAEALSKAGDADGSLALTLRQLRRRLA